MAFLSPRRPAEMAESQLIEAILDKTFPINSFLPPERELSLQLGVTRPTLREALQRLNRDGWIEIRHGKSTRIRDFWREGNLTILGTIARRRQPLSLDFVANLLQIRTLLAPTYFRMALENEPNQVLDLLDGYQDVSDIPSEFTRLDWVLHSRMTCLSGNPVFTLILNGFYDLYQTIGLVYFATPTARNNSSTFYRNLHNLAGLQDLTGFEIETKRVMEESMSLWRAESA